MTDTLYTIPKNWRWVKLGEVCNFERGITFPANAKENKLTEKNIPCIRTANVQSELDITDLIYVDKSYTKNNSAKLLKIGDIIMSSANSRELVGKTCYVNFVPFEMTFGGFVTVIRTKNFLSKYIFYFLRCEFLLGNFISEATQTVNIANINTSKLFNYVIPLPPLAEQKRIVERLDSLFAKLDAAKKILQDIVDGYELRRAAILHRAFTGKLTADFRRINNLSLDDWQEKKLGELLSTMETKKPCGEFFRYIDIDSIDNKCQTVKSPKIIETANAPSRASRAVDSNNILFSMVRPYLKNIALIDESLKDCIASTGFFVCRCKEKIYPRFLYNFLRSEKAINYIIQFMKGDNSPSIRQDDFKSLPLNLPPLEEQKEISRRLDSLIGKENQAKEIAENLLSEIETLKKTILARAFRGELGTNYPSETSC